MKRWWVVIALLLSVGVNLGVLAALATGGFGQRSRPGPHSAPRPSFDGEVRDVGDLARGVGLDKEATAEFRSLHQEFFARARESRRISMGARQDLLRELTAQQPDRERIDEMLSVISRSEAELERAMVETTLKARVLLGDKEEGHYLRFLSSRMMRMGGGRPPGGFPPAPQGRHRERPGRHGPRGE